jgi:hypothetical protein
MKILLEDNGGTLHHVMSQLSNAYITTCFPADMVKYPRWIWSSVTPMWVPQILQSLSTVLLFSFLPSLHMSPNNLLFSTLWIVLFYPLHHMDAEHGLSSWNKHAGTLSITVNTWLLTGKPHCLQSECVLYRHNSEPLTAKFRLHFHPLLFIFLCSSYVIPWITNLKKK